MKNKIILMLMVLLFTFSGSFSQTEVNRFQIKGQVIDDHTKKAIPEFPIKVKEFNRTLYTNDRGEFLFNMPANFYTFVFEDYPYHKKELTMRLVSDTLLIVFMQTPEGVRRLEEIQVVASRIFTDKSTSITKITNTDMATLPAMVGERDLLKALSLNAGVTSSGEGSADIQVRGGLHGQNLFLLDKVPLYSTQHMFGMVSVYNPAIIKSAELYKSGFPAEYGGRIASVLDVKTKDVNLNKFGGEIDLSLLASKVAINVPLIKDKLGLVVAGRISNYSLLNIISVTNLLEDTKMGLHFADLNAGMLYKPTSKDELKLSFFYNSDGLDVKQSEYNGYSRAWQSNRQQNIMLNWQRKISNQSVNMLQFFADEYRFSFGNETVRNPSVTKDFLRISSNIYSGSIENRVSSRFSDHFSTDAGVVLKGYEFSPFSLELTDTALVSGKPAMRRFEASLFAQTKYQILPGQTIDAGLRFSSFGNTNQSYLSLEPRFSYHGLFGKKFSVSASVSKMSQNIHRVANPGLGVTIEMFHPSDNYLQPEKSWIYSVGVAKDFKKGNQSFAVKTDIWYKTMSNLVEFKDGYDSYSMLLSSNYMTDNSSSYLTQGNGKAYGIDISGSCMFRKVKLSADYTLMQARNRFDELNNGQWFAASTDIRHSLTLVSEIQLKKHWSFTATWQLRSGRPITLPTAIYPIAEIDFNSGHVSFLHEKNVYQQVFLFVETERNNARMRPFHKLDIAFNHTYLIKKKYTSNLSLGLYNVYNRANPAYYFIGNEKIDGNYYPVLKSISLFPVLPSFSWSMKF
jgi:hypothetical protein